jgi:excinuclease ABC subunit A
VRKLIDILNRLVAAGNTVVLIEHNMDIIKNADWVLGFWPRRGRRGWQLVAKGTPEDIANHKTSYTGKYLKKVLKGR